MPGYFTQGYSTLKGGRLDKWAGWPSCRACGLQLPQRCVYCNHCQSITPLNLAAPRTGGYPFFFLTTPGMAAAMSVGMAAWDQAALSKAVARALGLERRSMLSRGSLVVGALFLLSGLCNDSGATAAAYAFGITAFIAWFGFYAAGIEGKQNFQRELMVRAEIANRAYI